MSYTDNDNVQTAVQSPGEIIDQAVEAVDQLMFDAVDSEVEVLRDASRHIISAGGKRIRPRLVMLSFAATGGADLMTATAPAAAVELVHTASVVHDDINDHGMLRRGRPSVNSKWGRTFALLTGDFLFTKVYELMAPFDGLNTILSEGTIALVEGETLQAYAVKHDQLNSEMYMKIIGRKTAALFRSGAKIGATLAGATQAEVDALGNYGWKVGLAFQIIDDILDLVGNVEQTGKTIGIDQAQGKGFASVSGDDPVADVKNKLLKGDRIERARLQARQLVNEAIDELDNIPDSPFKDEMVKLANAIIDRKK